MPPAARRNAARTPGTAGLAWDEAPLAPVVLVTGAEQVLAERAVQRVLALARERDPDVDIEPAIEGAGYPPGHLAVVTSPSLFGTARAVVVRGIEDAGDALTADLTAYLAHPADDVVLVLVHRGGQRGRALLDAIRAAGHPVVACEPIKRDGDKLAFVTAELRREGRRIDARAAQALVDAVGSDLRELVAACAQLVADTTGTVTVDAVARYHGGRVEASGFRVADAAVAGDAAEAVTLLRHAVGTGAEPVVLVAALAAKLRTLAKVAATRGRGLDPVRDLGLAPWQVDRARRELGAWPPEALADAIEAVAAADAEVKGGGRDPVFAVERAVLRVAGSARR